MATLRDDVPEAIVSFFVVTTAIAALWLSYRQVELSRDHNRLSTQPLLEIYPSTDESDDEADLEEDPGIYVENKGLGPALVKSVTYFIDKGQLSSPATGTRLGQIGEFAKSLGLVKRRKTDEIAAGSFIKEGTKVELLTTEPKNVLKRDQWADFLDNRFGVAIHYCSIYGVCRTACYNTSQAFTDKECK